MTGYMEMYMETYFQLHEGIYSSNIYLCLANIYIVLIACQMKY
jgi:hypothetical protein